MLCTAACGQNFQAFLRKAKKETCNQKHVNIIVNILPLWLNQTHAGYKNPERDLSSVVFLFFNTTKR